jgi:methionyl-tRNA synthetase
MLKNPIMLITTPIFYPNDFPHIGTAYPVIAVDVLTRWKRLKCERVVFLTGTDEHGKKIEAAAQKKGIATKEFVDGRAVEFKTAFEMLGVNYDRFIRTTDDDHVHLVQTILQRVYDRGDIYPGTYEGLYCVDCEAYYRPDELKDRCCPLHFRPVETLAEKCYFFRLSRYGDALLRHYREYPDFIAPATRRNEMVSFVERGLIDFSISRTSFKWGIPLPFDTAHVTYVWFDALLNYVTGAGLIQNPTQFAELWRGTTHIVGRDILRFHTVHWPAMLMAAGIELPQQVFAHGFWMVNGRKFSKSLGNAIQPRYLIERYGLDALRYYMMRVPPFGEDGNFSETELVQRNNSELAHGLGNLMHRTTAMLVRYCDGRIPSRVPDFVEGAEIAQHAAKTVATVDRAISALAFHSALEATEAFVAELNRYVDTRSPWRLAAAGKVDEAGQVLATLAESIRFLSTLVAPFMPQTAAKMAAVLGLPAIPQFHELVWGSAPDGRSVRQSAPLFGILEPLIETKPEPVTHSAERAVLDLGVSYLIAQIDGVHVRNKDAALEQRKREIEANVKSRGRDWTEDIPEVRGYQEIYAKLGKRWGEIPSPVEALSQYIFKSKLGRLPQINTVVDTYNVCSLMHFLSIGAHDRTKIQGAIRLEFARESVNYRPLGLPGTMDVLPGEYYWRDDVNVLCRLDLKQGEATKIDESTRHLVLIVLGNAAIPPATVRQQTEVLCRDIVAVSGGDYTIIGGAGLPNEMSGSGERPPAQTQ